MSLSVQLGALRTRELRELLEDEDTINGLIRCSEKVSVMGQCCICNTNQLDGRQFGIGCVMLIGA